MFKHAIENYELKPDIFEEDDANLTKKERMQKELFMKAYQEVKTGKEQDQKS